MLQAEGVVGDLLEALGLTREGSLDGALLSDPGRTLKGLLHDARRRGKLLSVVQAVLTEAGLDLGAAQTVDGRDWLPVLGPDLGSRTPRPDGTSDHVDLSVVLDHTAAAHTIVGLGIRYTHDAPATLPRLAVHAVVPIVVVPVTGVATLAPGTPLGDVHVDASLQPGTEGGAVDVETLRAVLTIPTDGAGSPRVLVTAEDLRLGDADPVDIVLDTADPLVDQALHVGATLVRGLAGSADPRLGALLRLIGLADDPAVPPLPLADLLDTGRAALWMWLRSLATPAAVHGWVEALADLLSENAVVDGDGTPDSPARARLRLGPATLEVALALETGPDGAPMLTPRVAVDVESPASGAVPRFVGRAEVDVVALRLAAVPTATAVPALRLFGRVGPDAPRGASAPLVDQAAPVRVVVGSIAAGLALDDEHRVVPLLAAYEVSVGTGARRVEREKVDLTDAQAVADLGTDTLDTLVEEALAALGVGDEVRAALSVVGLRDPHGHGGTGEPAWPHRTSLGDLLADPLGAVAAFVADVVADGDTPVLLAELARLLPNGGVAPIAGLVPGSGTPADPWLLALDDDPAADVWLTCTAVPGTGGAPHRLTIGLRAAPTAIDVPAVGALTLAVDASLAALTIPSAPGARPSAELAADVAVHAHLTGRDDEPLRLGDGDLVVQASALSAGLRWTPSGGLRGTGAATGLTLVVDGAEVPLELPTIGPAAGPLAATGSLVAPDPPWEALEALAGYALRASGSPVLRVLGDLLGWGRADDGGPGDPAHLSLEELVTDPVGAIFDWLRSLAGNGDAVISLSPVLTWLSAVIGGLLEDDDPADGALRGSGTPGDPWALSLRDRVGSAPTSTGGARRAELVLWCEPDGPDVPPDSDLAGIALPSWLELGVGEEGEDPGPADLAALLAEAAAILPGIADVVSGRTDLATSIAALRDRLTGSDGLLPAPGETPARWTATVLPGASHAGLQELWEDETLDPATSLFVTGPLGDPARWPLHDPDRVVDLTAPGLPAEAFDLAEVTGGPGPWFVALPPRGAARVDPTASGDGFDDVVARLNAVVVAARAQAGVPITVVAHSSAGLPARMLAAPAAGGIGRLVTLGTPLEGATVGLADLRPTADAVHALRALWQASDFDPTSPDLPEELADGAALVATLDALLRSDPLSPSEFAAPATWPGESATVTRESVTGALDAAEVRRALVLAVRAALQGGLATLGALPPLIPMPVTGDGEEEGEAPEPGRRPVTAIATGVRHDLESAPDARGIAVTVRTTVTGPWLGTQVADDVAPDPGGGPGEPAEPAPPPTVVPGLTAPAVEIRVQVRREGGWLVGGPLPEGGTAPAVRPPRLRWAEIVLASELSPGGAAGATVVLHEAAVLGSERVVWALRLAEGATTLPAEARILLFRLASALGTTDDGGPLPATGAVRAFAEVLRALGLATLDDAGHVGLVAEAVERFLVAPGTALREAVAVGAAGAARRRALARALRVLAGVALPEDPGGPLQPAIVDVNVDGLRLVLDLDPMTVAGPATLAVRASLSLAGALGLSGGCLLELVPGGPRVSGSARLAIGDGPGSAPTGMPYLALDLPAGGAPGLTAGLDLPETPRATAPAWLPRRLTLWPPPADVADGDVLEPLLRLAFASAPATLARLGGDALRNALDGTPARTALDAVLSALGLLDGAGQLRLPLPFVLDPAGWLSQALDLAAPGGVAGRAAAALVDAIRELVGLGTAATPSGHLPLPYGLDLAVAGDPTAGGLAVTLGTAAPVAAAGAQVEVAAGLRILLDPAGPGGTPRLTAQGRLVAGLGVRPAGASAVLVSLRLVAQDAVRLDLVLPGPPERAIPLVPAGPGLGNLIGEAAVRLLPTVLDAVVAEAGETGDVVANLGDALGLRADTGAGLHFDFAALADLSADPAAALLARLRDHAADVVVALGDLAEHVLDPLPAGFLAVTASGSEVRLVMAGRATLTLGRSGSGATAGLRLDVAAEVPVQVDGTAFGSVRAAVGVDQHGLALVTGGGSLDGDLLTVVGVPLRPWVEARYAPAERSPTGAETPQSRPTVRAGLLVPDTTAGGGTDARAVVVTVVPGQDVTVTVVDGAGTPVTDDPGLAVARTLVPLLLGIATEALQDLLGTPVGAGTDTIADLLDGVLLRQVGPAAARRWAPEPAVLDPDAILGRLVTLAGNLLAVLAPTLRLDPLTVTGTADVTGSSVALALRVIVAEGRTWWLVDAGDVRVGLEVATGWLGLEPADGGLELSLTVDPTQPTDPVRDVTVAVRGLTIRVAGAVGEDLLDLGVRLRSVALSAAFVPRAPTLYGGRLALDRLTVPLGAAGGAGGNGVASKVLDADSTGGSGSTGSSGTGDTERPEPALSPEMSLVSRDGGTVQVDLRMGDGDGPWWIPLQSQLGPVYIEQFGFGVTRSGGTVTRLRLLVDGGVSLAGLSVQVDDLELNLPWPAPWDLAQWRLDLAGLAVGYQGSGVSVAGALLKSAGATEGDPPSYLGVVSVRAAGFGINAYGGFGVYPVPGTSEEYVSFFVVAALHAPLGGPPAFFLTGIGGGIGINRALVLPADVAALPGFPLVQALDPSSTIASDPMGALREMGRAFPPQRGAVWFAAGVSFTSFSLVEGVAVLSVSVGDGVEIALMGLARLGLPNPRLPIAQVELALIARFSTRDMVLWIQAQLTDNSWVISRDARLTGGFAFVTWFRTGDFVVTLGGYHPNFRVAHYPQVPRLGLSWTLGPYLSIRGEAYFALCSSAIMVGSRIDVSFRAGLAYARIIAGFDALVRFDPLYFEVDVYASVTGGIRIKIDLGWFGSITIDLSISIGARLHVEGPEVHGTAILEMGPVEVPFRFGPQAPPERQALPWSTFYDKYLRPGGGQVLSVSVAGGQVAAAGEPAESRNDGSDPAAPWLVLPEFDLTAATTLAARSYAGVAVPGVGGLGIGPMDVAALASDWVVSVRAAGVTGATGDRTGRLRAVPRTSGLPPAVWRALPSGQSAPPLSSGVDLVKACTTVDLSARSTVRDEGGAASFDPYEVEQLRDRRKPLPFSTERQARPDVRPAASRAVRADVTTTPQVAIASTVLGWLAAGPDVVRPVRAGMLPKDGRSGAPSPAEAERLRLLRRRARQWQAVPRPVRITEGLGPEIEEPVTLTDRPPEPEVPGVGTDVGEPTVLALLDGAVTAGHSGGRTSVTTLRSGGAEAAALLPRRAAPTTDVAKASADRAVAAHLLVAPSVLERGRTTVRPTDGGVRTGQAGGLAEVRRQPAPDPATRATIDNAGKALLSGGTPVVPGQALVLGLPNPHDDADPVRPALRIEGDAAVRVVSLDLSGRSLADATVVTGDVEVPAGTATLAVVGVGVGQPEASGLAGWTAGARAFQVLPGAALTPGAVVRGPATAARTAIATFAARGAAFAPAGDVVRGVGVVETVLPADTRTLVVALDRRSGDSVDGLVLGMRGVRRRTGPDGPLPPAAVCQGHRTVLVYPVETDDRAVRAALAAAEAAGRTRPAGTATVSVASDERWEVAAVIGSGTPADRLARDIAAAGVDALLAPLVGATTGSATVRWISGGAR